MNILNIIKSKVSQNFKNKLRNFWIITKFLPITFIVDIVGSCNLACPTCPSGGIKKNRGGKMSLDHFEKILEKIEKDYVCEGISLFNWTEPMLHPEFEKFVLAIKRRGFRCRISTNFNLENSAIRLFNALPDEITISLSGYTQDIYSKGHKQGDIEDVKKNMLIFSNLCSQKGVNPNVTVYYHIYTYNQHEIEMMKNYSENLGFKFGSSPAYYMPIERVENFINNRIDFAERSYIRNDLLIDISRLVEESKKEDTSYCLLQTAQVTIDCRGIVQLCCAVYDSTKFSIKDFLSISPKELHISKMNNKYCEQCTKAGLNVYANWHSYKNLANRKYSFLKNHE